jgi:GH15 family glucan-1,4-alpha-glucosidase
VRVGNAASEQFQLDVYGEVAAVMFKGTEILGRLDAKLWPRWRGLIEHVEAIWREPDDGIWEMRGARQHFTYSKVMLGSCSTAACDWRSGLTSSRRWTAGPLDRWTAGPLDRWTAGPLDRWKSVRDEIHQEVCDRGYDSERRTFTQYYGSEELDASVLNLPLVGFLPATDERVTGTIDAISRELGRNGFVSRYATAETNDGLSGDEGQFLACSFWLVRALALNRRVDEARTLFERVAALANDLGLLAEEYDVARARQVGNFPQPFSHLALILAAQAISAAEADAKRES